ncbi:MAG: hypothetical protein E6J65_12065 [Deltaproteobacteria bacterium]|nr:MAG: hypothetical protein E6J63_15505 [Deltaproteobacteria bacterium]TMB24654.1 MAG: hypothetical protein E6J65_12065 [Deltaproteobacteria bacterium]
MPGHPGAAVVTAQLGAIAQHLAALADRASSLPGGEQLGELRRAVAARFGFDPLTREGLLAAGLDPDRGAAAALFEGPRRGEFVAALPVAKPDLFVQTAQRLLVERAGFAAVAGQSQSVKLFERRGERVGVAVVRGHGLVARTQDPAASIADAGARQAEQSLAGDSGLGAARKRLGAQDFIAWAPEGSSMPQRFTTRPLRGDVAVSLQGSQQGIASRLIAQLPEADARGAQGALPGGGAALTELLPADAPLRARLGIAPGRLLESLRGDPDLAALLDRLRGADAEAFASVAPGLVVSLALARGANIGEAMDYGLDWRRKSPFDTVQLVALAGVIDRSRLMKAFDQIAKALPQLGARAERRGDDFQVTYAAGKGARFGIREIDGKAVAYLMGGPLRPDELRRTPRSSNPEAAALYENAGAALRVDFGKLASALRELPQSAYGSGPQSYVARSLVGQVIEPLRTVRLGVAAEAFPDRFGGSIDVELVAP